MVDLVPFGGVESDGNVIRWPPDGDFVMNVVGFQEAYDNAAQVLVNDALMVRVVSPVGLLLLKLAAWKDRHDTQPGRDAADIAYLLHHGSSLFADKNLVLAGDRREEESNGLDKVNSTRREFHHQGASRLSYRHARLLA